MARAKAMAPRSPENIIMCWMLELIFTLRRRFNTAATLRRWYYYNTRTQFSGIGISKRYGRREEMDFNLHRSQI